MKKKSKTKNWTFTDTMLVASGLAIGYTVARHYQDIVGFFSTLF